MQYPRRRQLCLPVLAVLLAAGPTLAQDVASPTTEPEATAAPAPATEPTLPPEGTALEVVEKLGGSWRRTAAAPFGAVDVPGGWTGTELVIVDPDGKRRAVSYLPALDTWSTVAKPPRKLRTGGDTHWTGSELLFVEPRGTRKRGLTLFDPVGDAWRRTTGSPLNEIGTSVWAGDRLVTASVTGARMATYDPLADLWMELPAPEDAFVTSLHWTGDGVWALARSGDGDALSLVPLDLEEGAWGEPSVGPLTLASSPVLWTGDRFISLATEEPSADSLATEDPPTDSLATAEPPDDAMATEAPTTDSLPTSEPAEGLDALAAVDASFDPLTGEWTEIENTCAVDTGRALWAEPLILDIDGRAGLDPTTGRCYRLPRSKWADRTGALRVWTGNEVIDISGDTGGRKPRRDGVAFDPYPGDGPVGVRLDKGSRPVRVVVPSLDIDLPVISTNRKVAGATPGYPACDVALSWSVFDQPGKPGTAWIMAHAQQGMFLPLLRTLSDEGKHALLGREVDVQLRDGRLLTYRTYRANPRAINTNIGRKGRKPDEHRLVLQTSTGIGTAPKLLVAARLVDVGTTDEPRPKPRPRACG